ncbi:MAG TPA: hypothetical protein VFX29_05530 [Longimicrobiaceae bacterium]|nr:hypothetical protein [Longimicrobiaceae bacterium]
MNASTTRRASERYEEEVARNPQTRTWPLLRFYATGKVHFASRHDGDAWCGARPGAMPCLGRVAPEELKELHTTALCGRCFPR